MSNDQTNQFNPYANDLWNETAEPPFIVDDEPPASDVVKSCARQPENDSGNGQRLLMHFGDDLLHVRNIGWHAWTRSHWELEGGKEITIRRAQTTAAHIALEANKMVPTPTERKMIEEADEARRQLAALNKIKDQNAQQKAKREMLRLRIEAGDRAAAQIKMSESGP